MKINYKITIESDLLEKIPHHRLSAIVEAAVSQLQKAYVVENWTDGDLGNPLKPEMLLNKHTYSNHFHLEVHPATQFSNHENSQGSRNDS